MGYSRIDVQQALKLLSGAPANGLQIVDVRDEQSYLAGHIAGALHLDNASVHDFLANADQSKPLLVYCYHGNMSQGAAAFFAGKGFMATYSLDGGFEAWNGIESW